MLTVTPNPTIDRQLFLGELIPGAVLRTTRNRALPGGKPIDVTRAAQAHGVRAKALLLLPDDPAEWFLGRLRDEGIEPEAVVFPGVVRETIAVYEDSGRATIINGAGEATPSPADWTAFCEHAAAMTTPGEWVVCSGSFPPGTAAPQIAELFAAIRSSGGLVAADTGPAWLGAVVAERPDLVSPNLSEATSLLTGRDLVEDVGVGDSALPEAQDAARQLIATGLPRAIVSAATAGLAWADADGSGTVPALHVEVANPAGAGDALLGGTIARMEAGDTFGDAVIWGVATAASAITQWVPGRADAAQVIEFHRALVS